MLIQRESKGTVIPFAWRQNLGGLFPRSLSERAALRASNARILIIRNRNDVGPRRFSIHDDE